MAVDKPKPGWYNGHLKKINNAPPHPARRNLSSQQILFLSFLIFLAFFSLTRLAFFQDNPVVMIKPDSFHYYTIVDQINKGFFPAFTIRTPGYPLFLAISFLFFKSNLAIIILQNLISLAAPLFFIFTIHKVFKNTFRFLPILASIGLGAFVSSTVSLHLDTCLATESLFVNSIILFFSFLFLGMYFCNRLAWIFCGLSLSATIIIRPAGLFFIFIFMLILIFSWLNGFKKNTILLFSASFVVPLLVLCSYNYFTIKSFSLSTFSEHALISYTTTFLEAKPAYEPAVNDAINQFQKRMSNSRKEIMKKSWNNRKLKRLLQKGYNQGRTMIFKILKSHENPQADNLYLKWRPLLKKISVDAIRDNPIVYIKYFYANMVDFFTLRKHYYPHPWLSKKRARKDLNYKKKFAGFIRYPRKDSLRIYYENAYIETIDREFLKNFLKEYFDHSISAEPEEPAGKTESRPNFFPNIHRGFAPIHRVVFQNQLWIYFFYFSLVFSLVRMVITRFSHRGAFLFFIMTLSALLHGVVVSLSSIADARLSSPLDFIYYLSFFLFPVLWSPDFRKPFDFDIENLSESTR